MLKRVLVTAVLASSFLANTADAANVMRLACRGHDASGDSVEHYVLDFDHMLVTGDFCTNALYGAMQHCPVHFDIAGHNITWKEAEAQLTDATGKVTGYDYDHITLNKITLNMLSESPPEFKSDMFFVHLCQKAGSWG